MRYASVDIGTNTVRLLIVEKKEKCNFNFLRQESKIARLGEAFLPDRTLKSQPIRRALEILDEYKKAIDEFKCDKVFLVATSAVREARNRKEFIEEVKSKIGFSIEVIDGNKEAELTHAGIVFFLGEKIADKKWVAFDIGGGSTEFMFSKGRMLERSFSVPFGVVKILERFIKNDPPGLDELENGVSFFVSELKKLDPNKDIDVIVANAGTVTTLAAIDLKLKNYSYSKTEGYILKKEKVYKILKDMLKVNSEQRLHLFPVLERGREDVIVVGAYLVYRLMEFFDKNYLITTNGSLREGILLSKLCYGQ